MVATIRPVMEPAKRGLPADEEGIPMHPMLKRAMPGRARRATSTAAIAAVCASLTLAAAAVAVARQPVETQRVAAAAKGDRHLGEAASSCARSAWPAVPVRCLSGGAAPVRTVTLVREAEAGTTEAVRVPVEAPPAHPVTLPLPRPIG
jgi:hypothetical protein